VEFGVAVLGDHPAGRIAELARLAEALGLDQVWVNDERFYRDVFVSMTLVACHTRRVKVGCMVTDPFVRHPALTAAAAASVDEVSGGRVVLGMGAGMSGFREMGIERVRPARALREAVPLVQRLTRGEREVTLEGELVRFRGGHLGFTPRRPVPVYVAGRGPRVLEVAGEVADGVIIGSFASEAGIAWGLERAARGARRAGRRPEDLATVSWLYTAIAPDGRQARELVRQGVAVAMWGSREVLGEIGVALPPDVLRFMAQHPYRYEPALLAELARRLPEELLDAFSVAGTAEEVAAKLVRIGRMGIGQAALWLFPPGGHDLEATLRALAADVIPRVRAALGAAGR
jgi:5,10-methylenetetrahydromethanopterin reductase